MRTTVTLEPDVERLLKTAMRERGTSFKQALNQAVRDGLLEKRQPRRKKFVQQTFHMGAPQNFRWDKALAVADAMEDEAILRKMALNK
jgi:hypothetical protein